MQRGAKRLGVIPAALLREVLARILALIDPDEAR